MNRQPIRALLHGRLATLGWTSQTAWEATAFTPVTNTPYQETSTVFAEPDAITLADSSRLNGVFQVRLLYPAGRGTADSDTRAKAIADAFPRNLVLSDTNAKIKVMREPHITGGGKQGDRDVTLIRVRFSDR